MLELRDAQLILRRRIHHNENWTDTEEYIYIQSILVRLLKEEPTEMINQNAPYCYMPISFISCSILFAGEMINGRLNLCMIEFNNI